MSTKTKTYEDTKFDLAVHDMKMDRDLQLAEIASRADARNADRLKRRKSFRNTLLGLGATAATVGVAAVSMNHTTLGQGIREKLDDHTTQPISPEQNQQDDQMHAHETGQPLISDQH